MERALRTNVYVDGFNLYYGALRKTPYRWVNLQKLFQLLLPHNTIQDIKYFTAAVSARPQDPSEPLRQQLFFRALRILVGVLNPQKNPSRAILPHIDFIKQIRAGVLQASQFPDQLTDKQGVFIKPKGW